MSVAAGAVLLFGIGFAGGRALDADRLWADDNPDQAIPPPDDATPEPGVTPDTGQPFWYVPYENAERMKPVFSGELNGIRVGMDDGPLPELECNAQHVTGQAAVDAVKGTYFDFDLSDIPGDLEPMVVTAEAMICEDGAPSWFDLELTAGDGAAVRLTRMQGVTWWRDSASAERWTTGDVAGRGAVFQEQIVVGKLGGAAVIVVDTEIDGSTRIGSRDPRWTLEFAISVAEELYQ